MFTKKRKILVFFKKKCFQLAQARNLAHGSQPPLLIRHMCHDGHQVDNAIVTVESKVFKKLDELDMRKEVVGELARGVGN